MEHVILHLCADIGSDSKVWGDNGYTVIKVGKEIGVENYIPPKNVYGVIANPVCTEFSTARKNGKSRNIKDGMFLVNHCLRIIKECDPSFWVLENPAKGDLKKELGEPRFKYQPWEYGSPWTKETALWGCFQMPPKKYRHWGDVPKNEKLYIRPNRKKPSLAFLHKNAIHDIPEFYPFIKMIKDDMSFRSLCSQNFSQEFFNVNRKE